MNGKQKLDDIIKCIILSNFDVGYKVELTKCLQNNMTKKEFIAKWYFIVNVEISSPVLSEELIHIFNNDMSIEEFEKWLDEQNEREKFKKWLEESELFEIWNKED